MLVYRSGHEESLGLSKEQAAVEGLSQCDFHAVISLAPAVLGAAAQDQPLALDTLAHVGVVVQFQFLAPYLALFRALVLLPRLPAETVGVGVQVLKLVMNNLGLVSADDVHRAETAVGAAGVTRYEPF